MLMRQSIGAAERQSLALSPAPTSAALPAQFAARQQGAHSLKRQARSLRSPVLAAAAVAERPQVSFAQQTPEAVAKENVATQKPTVRAVLADMPSACRLGDNLARVLPLHDRAATIDDRVRRCTPSLCTHCVDAAVTLRHKAAFGLSSIWRPKT